MQDALAYQDETALQAIFNLTLMAAVDGDWYAAGAHLEGMSKIVQLRGNQIFLLTRPLLHFKLDRIDLTWSLNSGQSPAFAQPVTSWDKQITPRFPLPVDAFQPPPEWDERLANVFADMQNLSCRVNHNRLKFVHYKPAVFQPDLTSIQTRLIHLRGELSSPLEEIVRLTMLAFMTTTFRIPGRKVRYQWVAQQLKLLYDQVSDGHYSIDPSLNLCILMFAAGTVADTNEQWIGDAWTWAACGLDWPAVRQCLKRIMWFEVIHDEPGEMVYRRLQEGETCHNIFQDTRTRY